MAAETEAVCCVQLSVHRPNPNPKKKKDYSKFLDLGKRIWDTRYQRN